MIEGIEEFEVDLKSVIDAAYYAYRVVFCSFRQGYKPRFGNGGLVKHMQGKLGELAFYKFCLQNKIPVRHVPFRNDYTELCEDDDFIVANGIKVEVKTSTLKQNPYVLYNVKQYKEKKDLRFIVVFAAINPEWTRIFLLGWISSLRICDFPIRKDLQSPAYEIPVSALKPMSDFKVLGDVNV